MMDECGDGVVQKGEACDDGNIRDGDGCSSDCKSKETCGNGIKDLAVGEACDDGNTQSGDGCRADCRSNERCGNGLLDVGEDCDDGNDIDTDSCNNHCKLPMTMCGNGIVDSGEECDSGKKDAAGNPAPQDSSFCTKYCKISRCGDGYMNQMAGEVCDDGNDNACGTCNQACSARQVPHLAQGEIWAMSSNGFREGDTFSISDGDIRLFFEFTSGEPHSSNIKVELSKGSVVSASEMAQRITNSIANNSQGSAKGALRITATHPQNTQTVWLSNSNADSGTRGNQPIITSVQSSSGFTTDFRVNGMSGGIDACQAQTGCTTGTDCVSGKCNSGRCQ